MAQEWKCVVTPFVRVLINDLDGITYDDNRIQKVIVIAAQLLKIEFDFANTYTSNIRTQTITPDPVDDDAFINFVSMKTALLILQGELKNVASGAIKIQDGPAQIDMSGAYTSTKDLYDKLLNDFEKAKTAYFLGNLSEVKVIFSAYQSPYTESSYPSVQFG